MRIFQANGSQKTLPKTKKAGVTIIISDKTYFKNVIKKQRRSLHNDKGSIHLEDITIVNIHAPNIRAPKYTKLPELTEEINSNTVIARDFNTLHSTMDKSLKESKRKQWI